MGSTPKLALPYPEPSGAVRDGAANMRLLAEAVEDTITAPLLVTTGDGDLSWSGGVAEVPWNVTDSPPYSRGSWYSAGTREKLVRPNLPGWYFVSASVRWASAGDVDSLRTDLVTRAQSTTEGTIGESWGQVRVVSPGGAEVTVQQIASIVRVPYNETDPVGFAIRMSYTGAGWAGSTPPSVGTGVMSLRAHWLSPL